VCPARQERAPQSVRHATRPVQNEPQRITVHPHAVEVDTSFLTRLAMQCAYTLRDRKRSSHPLEQRILHDSASFALVHSLLPRCVPTPSLRSQGSGGSPLLAGRPARRHRTQLTRSQTTRWARCPMARVDGYHEHMMCSPDLRLHRLCLLPSCRTDQSTRDT